MKTSYAKPKLAAHSQRLALENRLVFDGAIVATVAEVQPDNIDKPITDNTSAATPVIEPPVNFLPEKPVPVVDFQPSTDNTTESPDFFIEPNPLESTNVAMTPVMDVKGDTANTVIVVDPRADNAAALLTNPPANTQILTLDTTRDSFQQIADYLQTRQDVTDLHLLTWTDGLSQWLGNKALTSTIESSVSNELMHWGDSLTDNANIVFHGADKLSTGWLSYIDALTGAATSWSQDMDIAHVASTPSQHTEIVFIENNITDYQTLVNGVNPNAEVYVLDSTKDGLAQIAQILAGRMGIEAISIVSHGAEASVGLGSISLTTQNLQDHAADLTAIGNALSQNADILLYGCDVAAGSDGAAFIAALAQATQADIAASTDLTGAAALGGNWVLEQQTGIIEMPTLTIDNYAGILVNIPVSFATAQVYGVGAVTTTSVALADMNGDGKLDIVTADYSSNAVSVLINNGSGGFNAPQIYGVGATNPQSVALADMNRDGRLDIVTADANSSAVSVLMNNGGGFNTAQVYSVNAGTPFSVALADMNGDNWTDIVTADFGTNQVSVLMNNGSGGFNTAQVYSVGAVNPHSVTLADVNGDGKNDIITADTGSNAVSVLMNNGSGGFNPAQIYAVGASTPQGVALGDVTGDGRVDIVTADNGSNAVSVLINNGSGGFNPAQVYSINAIAPSSVALADMNDDGKLDIVTDSWSSNAVSILTNDGSGGFNTPQVFSVNANNPVYVALGDVNSDGKKDIVTADANSSAVSVLLNTTNYAPTTNAVNASGNEDSIITVNLSGSDIDGTVASFKMTSGVVAGTGFLYSDAGLTQVVGFNSTITASGNAATLYFKPTVNWNGNTPFFYAAIDNNGRQSANNAMTSVTVNAVNDAPTDLGNLTLTGVNEDTTSPAGAAINTLTGLSFADVDAGATLSGVAIVANTANAGSQGAWQYSTNGGTNWFDIGTVANNSTALALSATTLVRFVPVANYNGTPTGLTIRALDNTYSSFSTTAGSETRVMLDASINGGVTAISNNSNTISTSITAVNDAPTFTGGANTGLNVLEDAAITTITNTMLQVTDAEQAASALTYTVGSTVPSKGVLSKSGIALAVGSTFTQADINNNLIKFTPSLNANGSDSFTFSVADGAGGTLSGQTFNFTITPVSDVNIVAGITPVEGATGTFTITLDSAPASNLTINYTLDSASTATLTTDYTVTAGTGISAVTAGSFTILAGQTTATLNINALTDVVLDPNETVILKLGTGSGYQLAATSASSFATKVDYATGTTPYSVSTGDFNGDGKLDMAVANYSSNTVSVLLGTGTGTFAAKVDYATGVNPRSVSVGDFNGDGKLDLAVANYNSNSVSVLLGTGSGTFSANVDYVAGKPYSVSVGDFNGDGKLDLAVANIASNSVSVLLGTGTGTFAAKVDYATGATPSSVSVGDFNGDGKLDLAVANFNSSTVSVLLGAGTGTFAAKVDYATGTNPYSVSVGDFNGDGKLDLAVANVNSSTVSVLLGTGTGTFAANVDYATGTNPYSVSVGDFNDDGKLDLAVTNVTSNTVSVLLGTGTGTFAAKVDYATGTTPVSVSTGDFNGDGKLDLAVANYNGNSVSVLLNNAVPSATLTITDVNAPPTLGGTFTIAGAVNDNATTTPFSNVTVNDAENNNVSISITYTGTNGTLTGAGLTGSAGNYTLTAASLATVQSELQALVFTPTANQVAVGATVQTTFTLTPNDGIVNGTADATTAITATSINDAPIFNAVTLASVPEDSVAPAGATISSLSGLNFTDVDVASSLLGVAVNGNSANASTNGVWQYSTNSGSNWFAIGSVSSASSLVLSVNTLVRFVPAANFNGAPPPLSVRALDNTYAGSFSATAGTEVRATLNVSTADSHAAYSAINYAILTSITAVNDAPTLNSGAAVTFSFGSSVNDITTSSAIQIATLLDSTHGKYADVDTLTPQGMAITSTSGGTWYYNSTNSTTGGTAITGETAVAPLLLDSSYFVYFVPTLGVTGTAALNFLAWDETAGTASTLVTKAYGDATTTGGITAYSSTVGEADITVTSSNTAPSFVDPAPATLNVLANASATDIKSLLSVSDTDFSQTEIWGVGSLPAHGTLIFSGSVITTTGGVASTATASGSSNIIPSGTITYTPTLGYTGTDSFTVQVSDGNGGTAARTINVNINAVFSISGMVVLDSNNNGAKNVGESGLSGVAVALFTDPNGDGNPIDGVQVGTSTSTLADGSYSFSNIGIGSYVVVETNPSGYNSTAPNNDRIAVTLSSGDSTGNDFLDSNIGIVSGQVRSDTDNDGNPADADSGINGVNLTLKDSNGNVVATTTTDPTGNYSFSVPVNVVSYELVSNGNFETGTFAGWTQSGNTSLSDVIANTTTSNHTLLWRSGATGSAAIISQNLATVIGGQYSLSFDLYIAGASNVDFGAFFNGSSVYSVQNTVMNWTHFTFNNLTATSNLTELKFTARDDPSFIRLDNVSVSLNGTAYTIEETNPTGFLSSTYDADGSGSNTLDQIAVVLTSGGTITGRDFLDANTDPTLGGIFTTAGAVNDNATTTPFSGVTVNDAESNNVSIHITYTAANGTLTGAGLTGSAGNYTLTSASLATIQSELQALVFAPTANQVVAGATVQTTFTLTPNDGTVNGIANATTIVTATSINDAPTATNLSTAETYTEDAPLNLTDIVITDIDSANVTATLTLSNAAAGSLSVATSGAVTSSYSAGVWTASGAIADVNALLAGVTFNPALDFNANFTVATQISDGEFVVTGTKAFTGVAVNDAPTDLGNLTLVAVNEDTLSPAGAAINTLGVVFADVDTGATLSGVAIVANTANAGSEGAWQYSTNGGTNWFDIGTMADNNTALALSATTLVRFVPIANYNGAPIGLTVRALDNSYSSFSTTAGSETRVSIDTTTRGGSTAIANSTNTISTSITAVNDMPSFTKGSDQTVNEDAGAQIVTSWATGLSTGSADESGQTLSFTATNDNNALFSVQPTLDSNGNLSYTPAANANGTATVTVFITDNGGTANGGVDTSTSQTFTITVNAVNDVPSFTKGSNQTVNEDAGAQTVTGWATALNTGASNESSQTLSFTATNDNNALFSVQPTLDSNGNLSYTPTANANGTATVTVFITDNGGTTNSGVDTSTSQTFTITVNAVNDVPSFTKGSDQTVNEDAGAQTVTGWATALNTGASNESSQTLNFTTTNDNNSLFSVQPTIDSNGNLSYTPAANANGTATVTVFITDNGGTANGGVDTSTSQTFTITVNAVNDVPSFTKGSNQTVNEDAGAQTVTAWATGLSTGPADESGQTLSFTATNDNNALFSVQPTIDSNGNLSYTPAANATGSATVTVFITDNGANGGSNVNFSASQTFVITVNPINHAPSGTDGSVSVNEDTNYVFTAANFGFSDVDGNALQAVKITTLPLVTEGTLLLSGTPVNVGDFISKSDIDAGLLTLAPVTNFYTTNTYTLNPALAIADNGTITSTLTISGATRTIADLNLLLNIAHTFVGDLIITLTAPDGTVQTLFNRNGGGANNLVITLDDEAVGLVSAIPNNGINTIPNSYQPISPLSVFDGKDLNGTWILTISDNLGGDTGILNSWSLQPTLNPPTFTFQVQDNGGTANSGVDLDQSPNTFSYTIAAVNDAPVASGTATLAAISEDNFTASGATVTSLFAANFSDAKDGSTANTLAGIVIGSYTADASKGNWQYSSNNGTSWTSLLNTTTGTAITLVTTDLLRFVPAADYNGAATALSVNLIESGGATITSGNTVDLSAVGAATVYSSATVTVNHTITAINDAPSFIKGTNQTVNEDAGAQTVIAWATGLSQGATNESGQTLSFTATNDNNALFSVQPTIDSNGNLSYTPAANSNGTATVTVFITDNGGTSNGGVDTSTTQTFTITVNAVNDVPSFTKGSDQTVNEDGGAQTVTGWATGLSQGPADESSQTLSFTATNNNNSLFSVQPSIDSNGNLHYTPATNANGTATVTVFITDNGGTSNGGVDTSTSQTFTITVNAVNDAPTGLGNLTLVAVNEDTVSPAGAAINTLTSFGFTDVDTGSSLSGVAVVTNTANAGTQGAWQYSTNGGNNWYNISTVAGNSALVLSSTTLVRFVPVLNFNGTPPSLTVCALDNTYTKGFFTSDATLVMLNTTSNGGITTISGNTNTINTTIAAINDAPSFTGLGGIVNFTKDSTAVVLNHAVSISDVDLDVFNGGVGNYANATLSLMRNGSANADDVFANTGTLAALTQGDNLTVNGAVIGTVTKNSAGTLLLTFNATATKAQVNSALQQITYSNSSNTPPVSVQINWLFNDKNTSAQGKGGELTATGHTTVTITVTNDAPPVVPNNSTTPENDNLTVNTTPIINVAHDTLQPSSPVVVNVPPVLVDNLLTSGSLILLSNPDKIFGQGIDDIKERHYGTRFRDANELASIDLTMYQPTGHYKLQVAELLPHQELSALQAFSFDIPSSAFRHTDSHAQLEFSAKLANGLALPKWLSFNPKTLKFTGIPPEGAGNETVVVTAKDQYGHKVRTSFTIRINRDNVTAHHRPVAQAAVGKFGFSEQLLAVGKLSKLQESRALLDSLKQL